MSDCDEDCAPSPVESRVSSRYQPREVYPTLRPTQTAPVRRSAPIVPKLSINPHVNNHRWLLTQPGESHETLEQIRQQARTAWSASERPRVTSYSTHYKEKVLDEPTLARPTSPNRKNKPHPPLVFLTCRLHHVPGYHNADTTVGREPYKVDGSVAVEQQVSRERLREKFLDRPSSTAINQYKYSELYPDPIAEIFGMRDVENSSVCESRMSYRDEEGSVLKGGQASLHRYMRAAGPLENEKLARALQPHHSHTRFGARPPALGGHRSTQNVDYQRTRLVYQPTRARGDYLIHPDWPPTLNHHPVPYPHV